MNLISNPIFSNKEKAYLDFVLQYDFPERERVIQQLNQFQQHEVARDYSQYYKIMCFYPNGFKPKTACMQLLTSVQESHEDGTAPTIFNLYSKEGQVFELEIFNADSSAMDMDKHER